MKSIFEGRKVVPFDHMMVKRFFLVGLFVRMTLEENNHFRGRVNNEVRKDYSQLIENKKGEGETHHQ